MPKETPVGQFWVKNTKRPTTPMQALMEAAPGEEPEESTIEQEERLIERVLALCEDAFTEDQMDILKMYYVENLSMRDIGAVLGVSKDTAHRRLVPLRTKLERVAKERV